MSSAAFYSRRKQFFREWRVLWKMHGTDTLLGGLYALAGFYIAHDVGHSQVYDVITPFVIASGVAAYLAYVIAVPQARGATLPFYFNLPRSRGTAWDAHFGYLLCAVLWMEAFILAATHFKLGGANMTPHYRLHPEAFVLPLLAIAAVLSYIHLRPSVRSFIAYVLGILALCAGLFCWVYYGFSENANGGNNYYPARGFALGSQYLMAALLLLLVIVVFQQCRSHWIRRELGEIK